MRIMVTGGAGKIGSLVVRTLSERGHQVKVFDLPFVNFSNVQSLPNVGLYKGDLTNYDHIRDATKHLDAVLHLAALLPPASEKNKERTMAINVEGTRNILRAIKEVSPKALIIFSSSVSVYGNTAHEKLPIKVDHAPTPSDFYSESKIIAEKAIAMSNVPYSILRITGISAAELFEFPNPLQFRNDQRIEFIDRNDAALAIVSSLEKETAKNKILNIAGGDTWRMIGEEYIERVSKAIEFDVKIHYPEEYGWFDWYDTTESQKLLDYQRTSFSIFLEKLRKVFKDLIV